MSNLSSFHDPRPDKEWWFALQPGLSDAARLEAIKQAELRYQARFGCAPSDGPRVVMVGKTPMLAYAAPVEHPLIQPQSVIIEATTAETEAHIMQLTLL